MSMKTYIIDAIRTPIGNFGGSLKNIRTDDLAAIPIKEIINRTRTIIQTITTIMQLLLLLLHQTKQIIFCIILLREAQLVKL